MILKKHYFHPLIYELEDITLTISKNIMVVKGGGLCKEVNPSGMGSGRLSSTYEATLT